jgi:hypothetical protein
MRRTIVGLAVFAAALCVSQAHAQWAVFDSTNYANAVKEYRQVEQLYTTANQTRDQVIQTYNLARQMAQMPQDLYQRYATDFAKWKTVSASNTYSNTAEWVSAANGDRVSADSGYRTAGIQLVQPLQTALAKLDDRSQQFVKAQYATAELADGVSVNALSTLGDIRARSISLNRKIDQLSTDSFSRDPNQQTEMAVLGKINTATLMQLRSQQDTNQILTAAALHQMLSAKEQFDQQKRALNQAIYFQQNFQDSMNQITSGMSRSMQTISFSSPR